MCKKLVEGSDAQRAISSQRQVAADFSPQMEPEVAHLATFFLSCKLVFKHFWLISCFYLSYCLNIGFS